MKHKPFPILYFTFFIFFSLSCKNYVFDNPMDASVQLKAPSNVKVTSFTSTQVTLTWKDNNKLDVYRNARIVYEINQSEDGTNFALVFLTNPNVTTVTITATFDSTKNYYFKMRASIENKKSSYSNVANSTLRFTSAEMISVQVGTYQMGSNVNSNEQPIHSVTLSNFSISKYEVTHKQWKEIRDYGNSNGYTDLPSGRKGYNGDSTHPVTEVSWYDIMKWCNALSEKEGITPVYYTNSSFTTMYKTGNTNLQNYWVNWNANGFRLPTEAEWEYAARGGIHASDNYTYSGSNDVNLVAWYYSNSGNNTHTVGTKQTNQLGIYDMSGNVWEWCWDWYGSYGSSAQTNPQGPTSGEWRVLRGGSFNNNENNCRVALRSGSTPGLRLNDVGFRVCRTE